MAERTQRRWTEDEVLAVLSLYCQIPFGKMHTGNPQVATLAERIDRTPSSVALKLANLASLDPYHQSRGVAGMRNASTVDRRVWEQHFGQWDKLPDAYVFAREDVSRSAVKDGVLGDEIERPTTEVIEQRTARRGQQFFRNAVFAAYDNRCCVTEIACAGLLRASHIVPWAESETGRLDPCNGLCLNSLHDAAFDRGLVAFSADCRLILAASLDQQMPRDVFREFFGRYDGAQITTPDRFAPNEAYLSYHRERVFVGC
jgi:hypothetical protein